MHVKMNILLDPVNGTTVSNKNQRVRLTQRQLEVKDSSFLLL